MTRSDFAIAVLISGRGSNLQALIDAIAASRLQARIVLVASNRRSAAGLLRAEQAGIRTLALDAAAYADRAAYDAALFDDIAAAAPDLIVLAGFMRVLDARAIAPWEGRMINIHPSLLPKYPGLRTHERALAAGDALHGASVHYVTAELDGGPVIAQAEIAPRSGDTPDTLAERLLPREHALLTACVAAIASGRVRYAAGAVTLDGMARAAPLRLGADGALLPAAE
jgi:phosphoribosylglycinamide formyltransferase-1